MDNRLATGTVWHRRHLPRVHAFRYRLCLTLLDSEDMEAVFARSRLWSVGRLNLVSYRRSDYLGSPDVPLAEAVRDKIQAEVGVRPAGPVFVLTHLRQWGLCFNPVSFYFCHDRNRLAFIVAEVHNTPWHERHGYVLDCREHPGPDYRFAFDKVFHVSPFLPMNLGYDWNFRVTDEVLSIHMSVTDNGANCFTAGMKLTLIPMSSSAMNRMPLKFPFQTAKVVSAIYWQALRLVLKKIPFHSHPDKKVAEHL